MSKRRARKCILPACVLLLAFLALVSIVEAQPAMSVTPNSGQPGDSFTVEVWNLDPNTNYLVWLKKNSGYDEVGNLPTDSSGHGKETFTVPDIPAGVYQVFLEPPESGLLLKDFTVLSPSVPEFPLPLAAVVSIAAIVLFLYKRKISPTR